MGVVKCPGCGEKFDRDIEFNYSVHGNRYWHDDCWEKYLNQEKTLKEKKQKIHDKVKKLCGDDYVKSRVEKQINENLAAGKKLGGILGTLTYWYDVKGHNPKDAHGGIGIVEYVYNEAQEYYRQQKENKHRYDKVNEDDIGGYQLSNRELRVPEKRIKFQKPKRVDYVRLD